MSLHTKSLAQQTAQRPARRRRTVRTGTIAGVVVALGLLISACGGDDSGPGVASAGSSTKTDSSSSSGSNSSSSTGPIAYAQCMRDHGVPGFPDPDSDGHFAVNANELGIPPGSPQFDAAQRACAGLLPAPSDEQQADNHAARLEYAQCMRDQGITDFPDPALVDGPSFDSHSEGETESLGFDPDSPVFKAAHEACKHFLPAGEQEPVVSGGPAR
jgi:hypothetical protein